MTTGAQGAEIGRSRPGLRMLGKMALTLGLVGLIVGGLSYLVFFSSWGPFQFSQLSQERERMEQENARLAEENTRLARTIDRLHNDPDMIQDLIRRELNFVKKNEVIVQLAPQGDAKVTKAALLPDKPPPAVTGGGQAGRTPTGDHKTPGKRKQNP